MGLNSMDEELWEFERRDCYHGYLLHNSMLSLVRLAHGGICHPDGHEQWNMVSSVMIWFVWKARCKEDFEGKMEPPVKTVLKIWLEIIHTLRRQYDVISGSSDRTLEKRFTFHKFWQHDPFYIHHCGEIQWQYALPKWQFPPFYFLWQSARTD